VSRWEERRLRSGPVRFAGPAAGRGAARGALGGGHAADHRLNHRGRRDRARTAAELCRNFRSAQGKAHAKGLAFIDRHAVQHGTVEKLHARGVLLEPLPD